MSEQSQPRARDLVRRRKRRRQNLEMALGALGFLAALAFLATVDAELHGRPALGQALVLLVLVVGGYYVFRSWRRC